MRISDWSSDVFSSDLLNLGRLEAFLKLLPADLSHVFEFRDTSWYNDATLDLLDRFGAGFVAHDFPAKASPRWVPGGIVYIRSEEHTSELQSLMRISYAVFCLKKKKKNWTQVIEQIEKNYNTIYTFV